jgi:DNA-directed RNA polymerase specialized sigma24 family protein
LDRNPKPSREVFQGWTGDGDPFMAADGTDRSSITMGGEDPSFAEFIRRVRKGDEQAAKDLVERFEPAIRRAVRVRLRDPGLRRLIESVDICQSVFASFFVRTALGQFELDSPDKLIRLLAAIARNKVAFQANRERAARRDHRRINRGAVLGDCPAPGSTPSEQLAARELVQEARKRMTADELRLLELRELGHGWARIATELGGRPDALRIRLARAVARITRELGLDEGPDDGETALDASS